MFSKDLHLLNELYSQKVLEMNIGPKGDNVEGAGLSPIQTKKIDIGGRPCLKCVGDEDCEGMDGECGCGNPPVNHEDTNASMAKQSLFRLTKLSAMLHDLICTQKDVEPWVLSKVTEALNHIDSVYGYMDYESYKDQVDNDIAGIAEETEMDLYNKILHGGTNIVKNIKTVLAAESKANLENLLYETITALELKKN